MSLVEQYMTTLTPDYGKKVPFEVFKNPSVKEWRDIQGSNSDVRGIIVGDDLIAWTTYGDLHFNVMKELNLGRDIIPVLIYGTPHNAAHILVTDASRQTDWWHNSEIIEKIETGCRYLRRTFTSIEVSFYDEVMVGRWDSLEKEEVPAEDA